jgi:hypothetical protein
MLVKKYILSSLLLFQIIHAIPPHGTTQPTITALSKPQPANHSLFSSCFPSGCITEFACCIISYLPFKNTQTPYDKLKIDSLGFSSLKKKENPGISS